MIVSCSHSIVLERAFRQQLVCPEFTPFCTKVSSIFEAVRSRIPHSQGATASLIPQLAKVNPELFGLSICTVDGQRFNYGDSFTRFCIQSCVKPLTYGMALEQHGEDEVHKHIGIIKYNNRFQSKI